MSTARVKVVAKKDEPLDSLIRRFKKEVMASGIMEDLGKHEYYRSPSLKRKEKHENAMRRLEKVDK